MSKRLLLQNSLTYFAPDKTRDFGCIMCGDDYNFSRLDNNSFFWNDSLKEVFSAFDSGSNCVILHGYEGYGKSHILRRFAYQARAKFDAVVFVEYDKSKYICHSDCDFANDDSIILERCFSRIFTQKEFYTKRYSTCYFNKDSATDNFHKLSLRNTVLIIDSFYVSELPEYFFSLLEKGFKILTCVRNLPSNVPKLSKTILHTVPFANDLITFFFNGTSFSKDDLLSLCELFENRPSALLMTSNFLKVFHTAPRHLHEQIIKIAKEKQLNPAKDYMKIFYFLSELTNTEKEQLRTFAVIQAFFIDCVDYNNEKDVIFTIELAELFTSKSFDSWKRLVQLGYFNISDDGRISMEKHAYDFVLNFLVPTANNCPCFMNYINKTFGIDPSQRAKDLHGIYCVNGVLASVKPDYTLNLLDAYAYFLQTDPNYHKNVYCLMLIYIFKELGLETEIYYTNHLLCRNRAYLAACFSNAVFSDYCKNLYINADNKNDYDSVYDSNVRACLDIIRVCTELIRFTSYEHRHINEPIFKCLTQALKSINHVLENSNDGKHQLLCLSSDAIRLCEETFMYFSDISMTGEYFYHRCNINSTLGNFNDYKHNRKGCISVNPLESTTSFRMFGVFQQLVFNFLKLSKNAVMPYYYVYYHTTLDDKTNFYREMSLLFNRTINGFGTFFDFYKNKYLSTNVNSALEKVNDNELELLLENARKYSQAFYDGTCEKSSKAYANNIIKVLSSTDAPYRCARLLLDADFPISNKCLMFLKDSVFIDVLMNNRNFGTKSKVLLYIHCSEQLGKNNCCIPLTISVMEKIKHQKVLTPTSRRKVLPKICYAYVKDTCRILEKYLDKKYLTLSKEELLLQTENSDIEAFMVDHVGFKWNCNSCEYYLSYAFYCFKNHKQLKIHSDTIKSSLINIIYSKLTLDEEISREGFTVLTYLLCGLKDCIDVINTMVEFDLLSKISRKKFGLIKQFVTEDKK